MHELVACMHLASRLDRLRQFYTMRTLSSDSARNCRDQTTQMVNDVIQLPPRSDTDYLGFDYGVFATARDGFVYPDRDDGLFMHRTRLLSRYRYIADGEQFKPVTLSLLNQKSWFGYYIQSARKPGDFQGASPTMQTLELTVARELNTGGLCEQLELTNYSQHRCQFEFGIELDADFADQDEAQSGKRLQHGEIRQQFNRAGTQLWKLTFGYRVTNDYSLPGEAGTAEFHCGVEVQIKSMAGEIRYSDGALRCKIALDGLESARLELQFQPIFDNAVTKGPFSNATVHHPPSFANPGESLRRQTKVSIPRAERDASQANKTISQAASDLGALRMYCLDRGDGWIPAAGLPEFLAFFGRDVLITAMEGAILVLQMIRGALGHLAQWQTGRRNDWRDEQPGRMLHQAEISPMAVLNLTPLGLYYGTITTPALFPWALGRLWKWTADRAALSALIETALKALDWLDRYCISERTGFYQYSTHSPKGIKNQGWKDSADAIVYEDGSQVDNPIAICDCHGYVYASKTETGDMLDRLNRHDEAQQLRMQAADLKRRFNEVFWMPDAGFFAMGLDKDSRKIKSVGSNPLHCLGAGIIDESLVGPTVERLFEPDLYSGWGVRTLSNCHPAFNPHSYQRGSVWPF